VPQIRAGLDALGLHAEVVCTQYPWHAAEIAEANATSGAFDTIAAAGGDGTVHEVLNGLMLARDQVQGHHRLPALGVLPIGRGNDFGFGIDVPADLDRAIQILATGTRRTIDVGIVSGGDIAGRRYFANGVGIGFDAIVGFEAAKMNHLHGHLLYLAAALKTISLYHRGPVVHIEYDDRTIEQQSLLISVMNGRRMGGGFMMAPTGDPGDGMFDLCIARQISRPAIFALIPHFMKGTQASQKPIQMGRTEHIVVTATKGTLPAHADGETLCTKGHQLEMQIVPGAVQVISTMGLALP